MNRIFALMFISMFLVSCNKDAPTNCDSQATTPTTTQSEVDDATTAVATDCTVENTSPVTGDTGTTTSGTTSGTTTGGTTTSGSTGGTTSGTTTGGTTGSGLPTGAYTFDTNIMFINTDVDQQEKFDKAIEMIKKVVATEEFRTKVLNHTYNGSKTFVDNGGFTNAQIYTKILEAAETLQPTKNNTMDMEVELYYAATSTVGYTYANTKRIYVNTKYFNTNTVGGVAANLFHEWLHKIGFVHAVSYSTSRDYSVPYAVGKMISSIGSGL